mmetsp:Transcript_88739/g.173566  ORF Transcript_88739/g.173566 Transcript_88739/m.173566 type:complete len:234 (-) Transcript_88739:408-1109(-)
MLLQPAAHGRQLRENDRHGLLEGWQLRGVHEACGAGELLGRADAGDDVFALRVDQKLPVELVHPVGRVTGEGYARRAIVAHVPEDHGLHVHGRAPAYRDVMQAAVRLRALVHPRTEHSAHGAPKLLLGILGKLLVRLVENTGLVGRDEYFKVLRRQLIVHLHATATLRALEQPLEGSDVQTEHDVRIHLHEAPVAVEGEAPVTRAPRQALDRLVVQPEVEHGVHHPGHGGAGS